MGRSRSPSRSRSRSLSEERSRRRSRSDSRSPGRVKKSISGRIHVSDFSSHLSKGELERSFEKYGTIADLWMATYPPYYAFITFKHPEDADRAIRGMNDNYIDGSRVRVAHALPKKERGFAGPRFGGGGPPRRRFSPPRRRYGGYPSGGSRDRQPQRYRSRSRERRERRRSPPSRSRSRSTSR